MTTVHAEISAEVFSQALEDRDARALTSWFADEARSSIVDRGQQVRRAQVLHGREAIGDWLERLCDEHASIRVVTLVGDGSELTVIAECRRWDKSLMVFACTAQLRDSLISSLYVVVG